jgi:hypothetical protein
MGEKLMTYHQYCDNHELAQEKLTEKLASSSAFADFVRTAEPHIRDKKRSNLSFLLERPVHRAREYALLCRKLIKLTDDADSDFGPLHEALDTLLQLTTHLNDIKAEVDRVAKLEELSHLICGYREELIIDRRQFHKRCDAFLLDKKKERFPIHLILFSDMIMWVRRQKFNYKGNVMLNVALVRPHLRSFLLFSFFFFNSLTTSPSSSTS